MFLDVLGQQAALLPRLVPIGDIDEDELIFAEAGAPLAAELLALAPAIEPLERTSLWDRGEAPETYPSGL